MNASSGQLRLQHGDEEDPRIEPQAADDDVTVREARQRYFRDNGFGEDGDYDASWVVLARKPIPIGFPNFAARVRAVRYHDIHHVVTGYPTTWLGEAEISAWELASGCRELWAAWLLDLGGMMIGLFLSPRAVFRACVRGRQTHNLYGATIDDALLEQKVGALRHRLGLDHPQRPASAADLGVFAGLVVLAALYNFSVPALLAYWLFG